MLSEFSSMHIHQVDMFTGNALTERDARLMDLLDGINRKMGRGQVRFAGQQLNRPWMMRQDYLSPSYTTRWADLPRVT